MGAGDVFKFHRLQTHFRWLQEELRLERESHQEDVEMYQQELARLRQALEDSQPSPSGKD